MRVALDDDVTLDTEQPRIATRNPVNAVTTPPITVNVTDPPTISAGRAEKLPVKDSLRKRKLEAAGSIGLPTHIPSRKRKLSDAFESFGLPAKKSKRSNAPESLVAPPNRKLGDAFEPLGLPAKTRKHANAPRSPVGPAKRRLSNASKSFNLRAKKREYDVPESPVTPTLPTLKCEIVISAPVDPPVRKRKRDDTIEPSGTKYPRKRRRQGAPLSDDVAQSTPLPTLPARKRQNIEEFAPGATSIPAKQQANIKKLIDERFNGSVEESKENKFIPLEALPVEKRKRDDATEPSETKDPRKRRRHGDAPLSDDVAQPTFLPMSPLPARKQEDIEEFAPGATSTPVKQQVNVEEHINERFNGPSVELTFTTEELNVCNDGEPDIDIDSIDGEGDTLENDEAWREHYLQLCREVFGDGEEGDEEEVGPCRQPGIDSPLVA
jgi:hypothetical protein